MKRSALLKQFHALMKRNLLIILRNKLVFCIEILSPLLLVIMYSLTTRKSIVKNSQISYFNATDLDMESLEKYTIYLSPNESKYTNLVRQMFKFSRNNISVFKNEDDALLHYIENYNKDIVGIHFFNTTAYAIRYPFKTLPQPSNLFLDMSRNCIYEGMTTYCSQDVYKTSGFAWLQLNINSKILNRTQDISNLEDSIIFQTSYSNVKANNFYYYMTTFFFLILFVGFPNLFVITLVKEKELKIFDFMKIMGMRCSLYWGSWILLFAIFVLIISDLACLASALSFVFNNSSLMMLCALIFTYGCSLITFSLSLVPIFKHSVTAGQVVGMCVLIYGMIFLFISQLELEQDNHVYNIHSFLPFPLIIVASLFSPITFSLGMNQIMHLEMYGEGLSFSTLFEGNYSVGLCFGMLLVDNIIFVLLFLALVKIKQSNFWNRYTFSLIPFFIKRKKNLKFTDNFQPIMEIDLYKPNYELNNRVPAIVIRKLFKVFNAHGKNQTVAINDLSLDVYENDVVALLGHNGAGKSTLFDILTGTINADSGKLRILNYDIDTPSSIDKVRSLIGFCPQNDILHPDMTQQEHIKLFSKFKDSNDANIKNWVDELVPKIEFDKKVKHLSKGQKQKLKLALAILGNPKILFLDEPTTGMDIIVRNSVWKILREMKEDRVIMMSTHSMEEADIFADTKAILCNGQIKYVGSSIFLKNHFGLGYTLYLNVDDLDYSTEKVTDLVKSVIPASSHLKSTENTMFFNLPLSFKPLYSELLRQIEISMESFDENLKIKNFGLTMTTLEDVFIRSQVDDSTSNLSEFQVNNELNDCNEEIEECYDLLNSNQKQISILKQFLLLVRRQLYGEAINSHSFLLKLIMPITFLLCFIATSQIYTIKVNSVSNLRPVNLNYFLYNILKDNPVVIVNASEKNLIESFKAIESGCTYTSNPLSNEVPHLGVEISEGTAKCFHQNSIIHAMPLLINLATNLIMSYHNNISISEKIYTFSWPWPMTIRQEVIFDMEHVKHNLVVVPFAILTIASIFYSYLLTEYQNKCFRQLKISGVNNISYFCSHLFCDFIQFIPLSIISLLILVLGSLHLFIIAFYLIVLLLTILHIPSLILFSYILYYLLKKSYFVQLFVPILLYSSSFVFQVIIKLIEILYSELSVSLKIALSILNPPYALLYLYSSFVNLYKSLQLENGLVGFFREYFLICFISPILSIFIYLPLLIFLEKFRDYQLKTKSNQCFLDNTETSDENSQGLISMEYLNITSSVMNSFPTINVKNLTKKFPSLNRSENKENELKINNVSFTVSKGEVLGMLGPNGAGKSTIINLMVNEIVPTNGSIKINEKSITSYHNSGLTDIGYCPQQAACWDDTSVLNHLYFYLELKGFAKNKEYLADFLLKKLNLKSLKFAKVKNLSEGTKKKLNFAISQIGYVHAYLFDEPTAGLDVLSRKMLWTFFKERIKKTQQAVLLATHFMSEAEALCSKVAILVNGQIQCSGSTHSLKMSAGSGYILELKVYSGNSPSKIQHDMLKLKKFISEKLLPDAEIEHECHSWISYKIDKEKIGKMSNVFDILENNKDRLNLEDYNFSQSTLEQTFIKLFKYQTLDTSTGFTSFADVLHT